MRHRRDERRDRDERRGLAFAPTNKPTGLDADHERVLTAVCLATCALTASSASAKGKESPAPEASASPAASAEATAKPPRPTAYRGKILSVDAEQQRISLSLKALLTPPEKPGQQKVADEDMPLPADAPKAPRKPQGELKGGIGGPSGGEKFGLNW